MLEIARKDKTLAEVVNADGEIFAQLAYATRNEMAYTLSDIVLRRTGIATLGNPGEEILRKVACVAAAELKWDDARVSDEPERTVKLLEVPTN